MWGVYVPVGIVLFIILISIRQVEEFERGIKFMFGKYHKMAAPGWTLVLPIIQSMRKIDIRTKTVDVPEQDIISKDNISLRVSAVLYFKVVDAKKAAISVENYMKATSQLALTTMKTAAGQVSLDELLCQRDEISNNICKIVDFESEPWGIKVENVELKEIILPDDMKRVIAREAEAERERKAVITKSKGEVEAAENLSKAATIMAGTPGALHLRTLSTLTDISADKNTIVTVLPVEFIEAMGRLGRKD
jgi:regulator of protease activity HflC (stomatin/prohibitin superfamily)